MSNAHSILNELSKHITELQKKVSLYLDNKTLKNTDIEAAIDLLNDTIRKLDHAVERLIDEKV